MSAMLATAGACSQLITLLSSRKGALMTRHSLRQATMAALAAVIALTSAAPSVAAAQDITYAPGMGTNEAEPEGTPFALPDGLTVEAPIRGYNTADPEACDYKYQDQAVGKGEQVRLCMVFNNNTNLPVPLELPPGLIFVSRSRKVQNGIIAQRISIMVPPQERYFQPIFTYCTNSGRDSASLGSEFDIGNVTDIPAFHALFKMLEGKLIDDSNFVVVNRAVKAISNGEELDADLLAEIEALPSLL